MTAGHTGYIGAIMYLEDLEAVNIQHADRERVGIVHGKTLVDLADDPVEHTAIHGLGEGVTRVIRLSIDEIFES